MTENWILQNGDNLQFILFFSFLLLMGLLEVAFPHRVGLANRKTRWTTNFTLTILNVVVLSFLPVTFIQISFWTQKSNFGLLNQFELSIPFALFANFLLRGFISFFTHLLMHKIPLFWYIHRVHHLDLEMDISTTVRFHPLEFLITSIIGIPLVLMFGLSPIFLMLYELLDVIITLFSHSNIRLPNRVDSVLRYFIVTPNLHRIHHSAKQIETDSNFGAVFPIWDIVFRTYKNSTQFPLNQLNLGLEEVRDKKTESILWLLKVPFLKGFKGRFVQEKGE